MDAENQMLRGGWWTFERERISDDAVTDATIDTIDLRIADNAVATARIADGSISRRVADAIADRAAAAERERQSLQRRIDLRRAWASVLKMYGPSSYYRGRKEP
ncbi:hypothetical protein UFOVP119_56 [uncultured Caudovirales phage]|uniref:Uncharacterized protein n=1 Tax=uncultured Caudovirales phage TaxID=2100421 RepID=A0A6J5LAI9_9CAUD|nr:hypothetical protein UFOVP119_56 [uncultured Caudovirales phage]